VTFGFGGPSDWAEERRRRAWPAVEEIANQRIANRSRRTAPGGVGDGQAQGLELKLKVGEIRAGTFRDGEIGLAREDRE